MTAARNLVATRRFLLLLPPLPINSPVVRTVFTAINTLGLNGINVTPQFLPEGELDIEKLVEVARLADEVIPLVELQEKDREQLQSAGVTVRRGFFATESPVFPLAASIFGAAGREMAQRMVSSGRRNLVYVSSSSPLLEPINQLRYTGALQGCLLNGVPGPVRLKTGYHSQDLSGELVKLFAKNPEIDGFMCHEDILAMETIQALRLCGRMVPHDCSVIGVDNTPESALFNPPITSVEVDCTRTGQIYGEAALALFNDEEIKPLDPELVEKLTNLVVRGSG